MATKKPKTSAKATTTKSKTTKPKTAAKTVEKPVSEASKTTKVEKVEQKEIISEKTSCFKNFFAKKYEENESILTVFKNPKFYGALLGEVLGTALVALLLFAFTMLSIFNMTNAIIVLIAILIAVYAFSGACLNPIVVAGMMASRRMSVIRGVMYIIAEIIGAWIAWLIFNSFHLAGGDTAMDLPTMNAIGEDKFWIFAMVELLGAIIVAFFFARALKYKRSVFTFAATAAGGVAVAIALGYVITAAFFGSEVSFLYNPAAALMFQIFPTTGGEFGEIIGNVMQALSVYAIFPMIGGVLGFYLSDFAGKLSNEE
ncbi:MAG: aquaporin [Candidatus Saccharibacteria bacterium]|nr:aquaporin [Candidatus Saccharibacteria bacterium]